MLASNDDEANVGALTSSSSRSEKKEGEFLQALGAQMVVIGSTVSAPAD